MSSNLYQSDSLSSSPQLIDFNNNHTQKPNYRRTQSQPETSLKSRVNNCRRATSGSFYNKSSTTLFWDLVGRENYTTSLNNSPVLCNSSSPPEEYYFGFGTSFVNKFGSFPCRSKFSSRTVPTMIPKSNDSSINLLTSKFKGLRSSPASVTSTFLGSLDKNARKKSPSVPQQEELTVQEPRKALMSPIELRDRKADTEPVLDIDTAEQVY
jgi:hypothetical protein